MVPLVLNIFIEKNLDPGRTRTCNPLIRSQMPYRLGHRAIVRTLKFKVKGVDTKENFN